MSNQNEPKFKVGDKVKIVRKGDNAYGYADVMLRKIGNGKEYEIKSVFSGYGSSKNKPHYYLKGDADCFKWSEDCFEVVRDISEIKVVYKVDSMEFDTKEAAIDHAKRVALDDFIKRCGGEEKFVNYIMNNQQRFIDILTKEYK